MSRLVDADEIPFAETTLVHTGEKIVWIGKHSIDAMPTVDAVQVVRCRDCKYIYTIGSYPFVVCSCTHNKGLGDNVKLNDFCSYGERKED